MRLSNYYRHFVTITKHRFVVMNLCFKCGLYKRGLLHDLSKYSPVEFWASARNFQGDKSPINAEKQKYGYSIAWQHHKGHNPHHWEYWIDNVGTYANTPIYIPHEYVVEMICDWVGAGMVYSNHKPDYDEPYSEPLDYYNDHVHERIFNPMTKSYIEFLLNLIARRGINAFCEYCKHYSFL